MVKLPTFRVQSILISASEDSRNGRRSRPAPSYPPRPREASSFFSRHLLQIRSCSALILTMASSKSLLMSMGTVSMWGFSPGFDLLEHTPSSSTSSSSETLNAEPLRVLLVSPGDIRHVLATIAHRRRHAGNNARPLHIYVFEKAHEVLARHLLLLQLAQDWKLPLRQRCNLFLEVFGNARVQVWRCPLLGFARTGNGSCRTHVACVSLGTHERVHRGEGERARRPAAQRAWGARRPARPLAPQDAHARRPHRRVPELVPECALRRCV